MGATQFVYGQARDETTCGNYIIPMTTRLETQITSQFVELPASQGPVQHVSSSSRFSSSLTALWLIFWAHERQHLILSNRAFPTILQLGQGMAVRANRHSQSDTAVWDTQQASLNFGILFAWSAINTAHFSVCCIFTR